MRVSEMITELFKLPQNAEVWFYSSCGDCDTEHESPAKLVFVKPDNPNETATLWIEAEK